MILCDVEKGLSGLLSMLFEVCWGTDISFSGFGVIKMRLSPSYYIRSFLDGEGIGGNL